MIGADPPFPPETSIMNITHRIAKLEATHKPVPRNCEECGFPARGVLGFVETVGDDPVPTCTRCNQPLDAKGHPLFTPCKHYIRMERTS